MSGRIELGCQAFVWDGQEESRRVRAIAPKGRELTVYVENAGDFTVPADAVVKTAGGEVTFDGKRLDGKLRKAIGHAHDAEASR